MTFKQLLLLGNRIIHITQKKMYIYIHAHKSNWVQGYIVKENE